MKTRTKKRIILAVSGFTAAVLLGFTWLGYFGSDPFTTLRPAGYRAQADAPVAIIFSGDMGFRIGMGTHVAERLIQHGIPVIGVNSLTYFRKTRTPAEVTALVESAMQRALAVNPAARLILIGQSFGADMLHVGLANLPASERGKIAMVALVVPGATVEYRASPSESLTFAMAEADAVPTGRQLDWAPLLCVRGVEETSSLCPLLHQPNLTSVALPGGHPLHWDTDALYRTLGAAMARTGLQTGR